MLFIIVAFFYTQVSKRFIETKISNHVLYMNESITQRVEYTLIRDLEKLVQVLNQAEEDEIEQVLMNNQVLTIKPSGYGKVFKNYFLINDTNYYYNNDYLDTNFFDNQFDDYHQKIAIYRFKDGINDHEEYEKYIFFNLDNHLLFYPAKQYFDTLLEDTTYLPKNYYFLMSKDGVIHYQKDNQNNDKFFSQYLRNSNSENVVGQVLSDLQAGKSNVFHLTLFNEGVYLTYSAMSVILNARSFFIVYAYDSDEINSSMSYLNRALSTLAFFIIILFIIVAIVIYYLLMLKNSDIEISRLRYYYLKPFVIKINKKGKIKSFNRAIRLHLPELRNYRNIKDFPTISLNGDLFVYLNKQISFTVVIKTKLIDKYVRFVPVKAIEGYYLIGEDITDYENEHSFHRELALYNQVTKLPNHIVLRYDLTNLFKVIDNEIKYALIIIDIINFKNFNKLFGRVMGNQLLIHLTNLIKTNLDKKDKLYNFEADQFSLLLEIDSEEKAVQLINTIKEQLKHPFDINNNQLVIKIKAGIYLFSNKDDLSASSIYENAYMALKMAKGFDTRSIAIYDDSLSQFVTKEQVLADDLHRAIENNEFVLFLQPQYNNDTARIVAFEALIRWNNPKYRLQSPSHFIEVAEQNNMIIQIGQFVMKETFRIAKMLEPFKVRISMNVSPIQLLQAGFVNEIIAMAEEYQLQKGSVAIEITENVLVSNFDVVTKKLELLKDYGFSIHLDDFGTGYSSLLYLKNLPIDTIKIDREFIRYLTTDKYSRAIVSKIISLTKNIDLEVIAEGVEDEKQNQFLAKSGCNIIQGHLISPAVPIEQAIKLLDEYNQEDKAFKGKNN